MRLRNPAYAIALKSDLGQQRSMKRALILMLCPIAGACGDSGSDNRSITLALPEATATAAPMIAATAAPSPPVPAVWTHAPSARAAWYGPPNAPALLAISCEGGDRRAARLVVVRYAPADKGALALFAIQGSKGILRLPVSAVKTGKRGYVWRGVLDAADPRAEVLLGNGLKATVPGGGELDLPPLGAAGAVVSECLAAAAPPAAVQTLPNRASNPATSPAAR